MPEPIDTFEPGRRVSWSVRSGSWHTIGYRGRVERKTDATVWVQPDRGGDPKTFRANRGGFVDLHVLTPHELALEEWVRGQPTTKVVSLSGGMGEDLTGKVHVRLDAAGLRDLAPADALALLADETARVTRWLAERPTPPVAG